MPLDSAWTDQLRTVLKGFPTAKQDGFLRDLAARMDLESFGPRVEIFREGDPADTLYLLDSGRVVQSFGTSGQQWFQKELQPGVFLGQHSLFSGQHQTRAATLSDARLYRLSAADLRFMLDVYPGFQEALLNETRASRVRSIPLFENLSDANIRWLAELLEDEQWPAGQEGEIVAKPGVRIIDWGQVAVNGPAAFGSDWWLTAGNFFVTLQPGVQLGVACTVDRAVAVRDTHLFYLPSHHFNRLMAAFPEVKALTNAPLDIPGWLAHVQLFMGPGMTDEHRRALAQYCAWGFVPANQNITTQGEVGYSYVVLIKGAALVSAVDDQGRLRPRNLLQPKHSFGITSLLQSKLRDASVRAVAGQAATGHSVLPGAEILNLDRRDVQIAFAERPDLWHPGVSVFDHWQQTKQERPRYAWLYEGEVVVWNDRAHWFWLVAPMLGIALLTFLFLVVTELSDLPAWVNVAGLIILGAVFVPTGIYIASNYYDDYYVVTNRRVTRRDRVLFVRETRTDAPLDQIQDVTVDSTLMGRLANYGNVTVRTAAKTGGIQFTHVPNADQVREHIVREKLELASAVRGRNRENLRQGLLTGLRMALTVPNFDKLRALGDNATPRVTPTAWQRVRRLLAPERKPKVVTLPGGRRRPPRWVRSLLAPLPDRVSLILIGRPPEPKPASGEIIWRKHWINFVLRGAVPVLMVALLVPAMALALVFRQMLGPDGLSIFFLAWLVMFAPAALWLAWVWTDYRNDIYVVTDDKIIDIEKKPLALMTKRRESGLDRIQTVYGNQEGFWANLFDYGDVVIRTAAADEGFTFAMVRAPKVVSQIIFQKIDAFRRRQQQQQIAQRQRDIIEGLELYHDLRGEGKQGYR